MSSIADRLDLASCREAHVPLLTADLLVFPIRHHSPACALQLLRLFERAQPSVVLVEGPRRFDKLIALLTDPATKPPVAIYSWAVGRGDDGSETRHASFYPMCASSPELVALEEARRRGLPARFIDLDPGEQLALSATAPPQPNGETPTDNEPGSSTAEPWLHHSETLRRLAAELGCRDHEELWEHCFELPTFAGLRECEPDLETFVAQVATYCAIARADATTTELERHGTLAREAEMAHHIAAALAARRPGDGPVLAVVGGYHAVVLPDLVRTGVARPNLPTGHTRDEGATLVRYSFDRLDRLAGYSAGMTSPAWHHRLWEHALRREAAGVSGRRIHRDTTMAVLFEIAAALRERSDLALPAPTLIAANHQALQLAALRGRSGPIRADLLDAVASTFIKGSVDDAEGLLVLAAADEVLAGKALGAVPAGAGVPPLVRDVLNRLRRQHLAVDTTERKRVVLELYRRPAHRKTSRLLHGLELLGVPFAVRTAGPNFLQQTGLERLQEHWDYAYSPVTEGALVEASVWGVSLPLAVATRFADQLDHAEVAGLGRDAAAAARTTIRACLLGLHDQLPRLLAILRRAIAADAEFASVVRAATSLTLLTTAREPLEAHHVHELPLLLEASFQRAVALAGDLATASGDRADAAVVALLELREFATGSCGGALDAKLLWSTVAALHQQASAPVLRGACAGLLVTAGHLPTAAVAVALRGHLRGLASATDAVAYLRGLAQAARDLLWQEHDLVATLDELLSEWDNPTFLANLPELRLAFSSLTPRETDRVAAVVADLPRHRALHQAGAGSTVLGPLVTYGVTEAEALEHLHLEATLAEVLSSDGLATWMTPS